MKLTFNIYTQINYVMFLAEVSHGEAVAQHCYNGDVTLLWEIFVNFPFSLSNVQNRQVDILTLNGDGLA